MTTLFASLPWYDLPATATQLDRLWREVRRELIKHTDCNINNTLDRQTPIPSQWQSPDLLLSQCCGPDLFDRGHQLQVLGRPVLAGLDCEPGQYYSLVVTRSGVSLPSEPSIVINGESSWSGALSLHRWLAQEGINPSARAISGSHQASIASVLAGDVDVAAIDAFSFRFLETEGLEVIDRTETAPAPPFVCHEDVALPITLISELLKDILEKERGMYPGLLPADRSLYEALIQ